MLCVIYAVCLYWVSLFYYYADCPNVACRYTECHFFIIMLVVLMLLVAILSVVRPVRNPKRASQNRRPMVWSLSLFAVFLGKCSIFIGDRFHSATLTLIKFFGGKTFTIATISYNVWHYATCLQLPTRVRLKPYPQIWDKDGNALTTKVLFNIRIFI